MTDEELTYLLQGLIRAVWQIGDRAEQAESAQEDAKVLLEAADSLRLKSLVVACELGGDIVYDCARRLQETASRHDHSYTIGFADRVADSDAKVSWRELQVAEAEHARVCGLAATPVDRPEQMRRHALRLAAVAGQVSRELEFGAREDAWRPLSDLLLLIFRFTSEAGEEMPDEPMPRTYAQLDFAMMDENFSYWF